VIVVVHQTVGVTEPVKAPDDVPQALQEGVAIGIVLEDFVPRIASGRHMIDRPVKLQPKRTRHTLCRYHTDETLFKIQDLTPVFACARTITAKFMMNTRIVPNRNPRRDAERLASTLCVPYPIA